MDPSLSGLLGAYGSDDEEEETERVQSPGAVASAGAEASASPQTFLQEGAAASAGLALPLSAAPNLRELAEPANQDEVEQQQNGEEMADAEQLDTFWLPEEIAQEPKGKCPTDVQEKVREYIHIQEETGNTISSTLKALRGYKNPDFLQHCVKHDNIDQYGSCFPKDVFDPAGLPAEDYYDRLAYEWEQHLNRQRAAREATQRAEFVSGGTAQTRVMPAGLHSSATAARELLAQAKKVANKSSKWDTRR